MIIYFSDKCAVLGVKIFSTSFQRFRKTFQTLLEELVRGSFLLLPLHLVIILTLFSHQKLTSSHHTLQLLCLHPSFLQNIFALSVDILYIYTMVLFCHASCGFVFIVAVVVLRLLVWPGLCLHLRVEYMPY